MGLILQVKARIKCLRSSSQLFGSLEWQHKCGLNCSGG